MTLYEVVSRYARPHLRCGICDDLIEQGEPTRYVDDERCHLSCAKGGEPPIRCLACGNPMREHSSTLLCGFCLDPEDDYDYDTFHAHPHGRN